MQCKPIRLATVRYTLQIVGWNPRARLGAYLGQSPHHAANVSLVLNPATGYISLQFHCTYDDYFETPKLEGRIDVH